MPLNDQHIICPSIEEIIAAAKPGVSAEQRASIKKRLEGCIPVDETLAGAKKFLEDHQYDFEALHYFLEAPASFSTRQKKTARFISIQKFAIAATVLIFTIGLIWFKFYKETPEQIIAKAIFYEPGLPVFASVQGDKMFHELMSAYRMQDSKTGLIYFHELIIKQPLNDTLNYFGGWLFYLNKQPDSAAMRFEIATSVKFSIYYQKAQYMQATCLFITRKKRESKFLFENISQDKTNPYYEKALQLLADKRLW